MTNSGRSVEIAMHELRFDEFSDALPAPLTTYTLRVTHRPTGVVVTSAGYGTAERLQVREQVLVELGRRLRDRPELIDPDDPGPPLAACGALYDWQADGHPGGPQPPCTKPIGHEDGPRTDFKREEHSNGHFKWPEQVSRRPICSADEARIGYDVLLVASGRPVATPEAAGDGSVSFALCRYPECECDNDYPCGEPRQDQSDAGSR